MCRLNSCFGSTWICALHTNSLEKAIHYIILELGLSVFDFTNCTRKTKFFKLNKHHEISMHSVKQYWISWIMKLYLVNFSYLPVYLYIYDFVERSVPVIHSIASIRIKWVESLRSKIFVKKSYSYKKSYIGETFNENENNRRRFL